MAACFASVKNIFSKCFYIFYISSIKYIPESY